MTRKGQATIFIILGIVILIGAGLLVYLRSDDVDRSIETEFPTEVTHAGQQELRSYMDTCLRDAAYNGLEIVRLQAGHIDFPPGTSTVRLANDADEKIVFEDGIKKVILQPDAQNEMAYWFDSNNKLAIPSQAYVENSLAEYIEDSIALCVDNFDSFRQQNYDITLGNVDVTVELSDEVLVKVDYPITFERGDVSFDEKEFILRIDVPLRDALEIATDLTLAEYYGKYLERDVKYLISLYQYSGGEKSSYDLPPLSHTVANADCSIVTWQTDEANTLLQTNLASNIRYLTVNGFGDNAPFAESDIAQGVYEGLTHDLVSKPYAGVLIDFLFEQNNDFSMDISPKLGTEIKPDIHRATNLRFLPMFCNVRYRFKYDLKFPLFPKQTFTLSNAINIEGKTLERERVYEFISPLGVFVCGNQERDCTGSPDESFTLDEDALGFALPQETLFCEDDNQRSQPMKITVVDKVSQELLDNIPLSYRCGRTEDDCLLGSTQNGVYEGKLPLCVNGQLYALKQGYAESYSLLTTEKGETVKDVRYEIFPLQPYEVDIKIVDLPIYMFNYMRTNGYTEAYCEEEFRVEDSFDPQGDELFTLVSAKEGASEIAFAYPPDPEQEPFTIDLAPGAYSFIYYVQGSKIIADGSLEGQTFSLNNGGLSDYIYPAYPGVGTSFGDEILDHSKITFYVPLESTSRNENLLNVHRLIQDDESVKYTRQYDHDCDPLTPIISRTLTLTKEQMHTLFKPTLE
ncbi:hypothetical protein GOV09_03935 [Candidatus Woesearchaeota archaeon]|nr:hypothetical protein [Candidatus Woesearchaeota archaeon]